MVTTYETALGYFVQGEHLTFEDCTLCWIHLNRRCTGEGARIIKSGFRVRTKDIVKLFRAIRTQTYYGFLCVYAIKPREAQLCVMPKIKGWR